MGIFRERNRRLRGLKKGFWGFLEMVCGLWDEGEIMGIGRERNGRLGGLEEGLGGFLGRGTAD